MDPSCSHIPGNKEKAVGGSRIHSLQQNAMLYTCSPIHLTRRSCERWDGRQPEVCLVFVLALRKNDGVLLTSFRMGRVSLDAAKSHLFERALAAGVVSKCFEKGYALNHAQVLCNLYSINNTKGLLIFENLNPFSRTTLFSIVYPSLYPRQSTSKLTLNPQP